MPYRETLEIPNTCPALVGKALIECKPKQYANLKREGTVQKQILRLEIAVPHSLVWSAGCTMPRVVDFRN